MVWFGLPNDPSKAYFLNEREMELMEQRSVQRAAYMGSEEFSWEEIKIALKDPKVYLRSVLSHHRYCSSLLTICRSGAVQFCQDILLYGFSTFLPS